MIKRLLSVLLLATPGFAGDIVISQFRGLNTQDNPATLVEGEAQDLLNVGLTPGGKSVYVREGYGLHKTLGISTSAVHGGHYFQDSSASDVQVWGNDLFLNASVNGASPVQVATGTLNATWQCADSLGFAYCLTSARDTCVRTAGTVATTGYRNTVPSGTMVTFTPDRMVVSGVSSNESTLYFSKANTPTDHTIGPLTADAFTEVINAPGSRINHIRYACGKLLWWKDASFGYSVGDNQYNMENVTVSANIGTLDNASDEYNGIVYFRGQDSHIYQYDCSNVVRLSRKITPTVKAANRRRANSWTQSTLSDFNNGVFVPTVNFSTTVSPGDITMSTFSAIDTASANFVQGTGINITYQSGDLIISTNATTMTNGSFETGDSTAWVPGANFGVVTSVSGTGGACSIASPQSGTYFAEIGGTFGVNPITYYVSVWDATTSVGITTTTISYSESCSWTSRSFTLGSSYARRRLKIAISNSDGTNGPTYSDPFVANGTNIAYYTAMTATCAFGNCRNLYVDNFSNSFVSAITSATYTSRTFDTNISSPLAVVIANWTSNDFTPYVELQTSTDSTNGAWTKITGSTNTNVQSQRYLRYISSFTSTSTQDVLSTLDDVTVIAKSTGGVYYSAVNNASGVTSWSTFGANDTTTGGTITYYVRASTALFTIQSATPTWISQSKNATVSYATGTYMQARMDFTTTASSATLSLADFSFNWFEGSALDKAYVKYWNDYVWVAVSSGTTGLNNRILRWDILNEEWLLDDIASNGFLVDNGDLYFGSPSVGKVYKYGQGLSTDDSGAITSYWKSKNFSGADPFVQNTFDQADFIVKAASPTVMTVVYQIDGSTSTTSYSMSLYSRNKTILHKGVNLSVSNGTFYNVKFGNTSGDPRWEVFGYRARYTPLPWRPE